VTNNRTLKYDNYAKGYCFRNFSLWVFFTAKKTPEFCSLKDCLSNFHDWTNGKKLEDTLTFKVDGGDVQEAYCFSMHKSNSSGNYLLTTWNKVPMAEGGVPTANGSAKVGHVDVKIAHVANGNIPGYPTYFYFIPSKSVVFAMRSSWQPHNGHQGLVKMITGFLETASPYVVTNSISSTGEIEIVGFRDKNDRTAPKQLVVQYESVLLKLAGRVDYLRRNHSLIRKIVFRNTLDTSIAAEKSLMYSVLQKIGLTNHSTKTQMISFGYEMQFTPTLLELNALIEKYSGDTENKEHIGFRLAQNSSETIWLNHSYAKDVLDLNLTPEDQGVISGRDLLNELEKNQLSRLKGLAQI